MTDPTDTATKEPTIVTVFEHHDADGADLNVAVVRPHNWHFLTAEEARELANKLLDAADVAEECSQELRPRCVCARKISLHGTCSGLLRLPGG